MRSNEAKHTCEGLPYLLFTPDAAADFTKRIPLIVFLHGWGERAGYDSSERSLVKLMKNGLPHLAGEDCLPRVGGQGFPLLVACPQAKEYWKPRFGDVVSLVDELVEERGADPTRCYLTGVSMGAFAAWEIAARAPHYFAALLPVSGGVPPEAMEARELPAWIFLGGLDEHYPPRKVQADLDAHRGRGAEITVTINPDARHDDTYWNDIYARPYVYQWLLSHTREQRETLPSAAR